MKLKKVYIGVAIAIVSLAIVIASIIFYIKANQKDVEVLRFAQSINRREY